jgi:protein-tyrosine phosphatase
MLADILDKGFIPIIAHCEQLVLTKRDAARIDELFSSGCRMQKNAETVLVREKGWFRDWVFRALEDGTVSYIASDAHDTIGRKPLLREAYDHVTKLLGTRFADDLFGGNATKILEETQKPFI